MRKIPLSLALATAFVAACGGGSPDLPEESTLAIQAPDETDGEASQPLCATGDGHYRDFVKQEIEEFNDAAKPYLAMYRLARGAAKFSARADGRVEKTHSGTRGSLTIAAEQKDDGSTLVTVTAALKGEEDRERLLMEGTVAADGLSGTWKIFGRDGAIARSVEWTRTEAGDVSAHWKNERNGKTAEYARTAKDAMFELTNPGGASLTISWNVETKVGDVAVLNATGAIDVKKCWDASFCNVECPAE